MFDKVDTSTLTLSEGGVCVSNASGDPAYGGAIAGATTSRGLSTGRHQWLIEKVAAGTDVYDWMMLGVCRPSADHVRASGGVFQHRSDTWLITAYRNGWSLGCQTHAGSFDRYSSWRVSVGERLGLVLDLDHGGTLTLFRGTTAVGTIAEGLVGPLLPCVAAVSNGVSLRVHTADLKLPPK